MYKNNFKYLKVEMGKCDFPSCHKYGVVITITDLEGRKSYCDECIERFRDIMIKTYPKEYSKYVNDKMI